MRSRSSPRLGAGRVQAYRGKKWRFSVRSPPPSPPSPLPVLPALPPLSLSRWLPYPPHVGMLTYLRVPESVLKPFCIFSSGMSALPPPPPLPPPFCNALRPAPHPGEYLVTRGAASMLRCKAYTAPPIQGGHGQYITTIAPDTYLGPIEETVHTPVFTTVLIRGYWINVWRAHRSDMRQDGSPFPYRPSYSTTTRGILFAPPVPSTAVQIWYQRGWVDSPPQ